MDAPRPPTNLRLFDWRPSPEEHPPPPRALAALLLRGDTPSGLASFLTPETVLPRGVVAQLEASVALGHLVPTEAGRRFLAALAGAPGKPPAWTPEAEEPR